MWAVSRRGPRENSNSRKESVASAVDRGPMSWIYDRKPSVENAFDVRRRGMCTGMARQGKSEGSPRKPADVQQRTFHAEPVDNGAAVVTTGGFKI